MKSRTFVHASGMGWEDAGEGMRRKILGYNEEMMMVRVEFDRGAVGSVHTHPHRQVTYVESGRFEVEIDGNKEDLTVGDSFIVESNVSHGVRALEGGCLIDVFMPLREDFLVGKK